MDKLLLDRIIALLDSDNFAEIFLILSELTNSANKNQIDGFTLNILKIILKAVDYKSGMLENDPEQLKKGMNYVQKYFLPSVNMTPVEEPESVIWWCWLQGLDNAPPIVKACYNSLSQLNIKVNVITSQNYDDYISLPAYILQKWKSGIISNAHFSDILRLELLTTKGGIWIDATVLITGKEGLKQLLNRKLFVFSHIMRGVESKYITASSWLIASNGSSLILNSTKEMLWTYWENENVVINYFLLHLFFTMACNQHQNEWAEVPAISNVPPHILQSELLQPYTEERWAQVCKMSDFHKLTYKGIDIPSEKGTFYEHIIEAYT